MEITASNLNQDYNYINKDTFIIKDAKQTSSWNGDEEYFQNLFNLHLKRANTLEIHPFSNSHQISNDLVLNMKKLVKDLKKGKDNNIGFNENY